MKSQKEVANIVEGAGMLLNIAQKISDALCRKSGTAASLHSLSTPHGEVLIEQIADVLVNGALVELPVVHIGEEQESWASVYEHCHGLNELWSDRTRETQWFRTTTSLQASHADFELVPLLVTRHISFNEVLDAKRRMKLEWARFDDVMTVRRNEGMRKLFANLGIVVTDDYTTYGDGKKDCLRIHSKGMSHIEGVWVEAQTPKSFYPGEIIATVR